MLEKPKPFPDGARAPGRGRKLVYSSEGCLSATLGLLQFSQPGNHVALESVTCSHTAQTTSGRMLAFPLLSKAG